MTRLQAEDKEPGNFGDPANWAQTGLGGGPSATTVYGARVVAKFVRERVGVGEVC